jgi:serine/threonine protein kinase
VRASAKLNHPNIIAVYDYGALESQGAFLVMELVHGVTLRRELKRLGRLEPRTAARYFRQVLEGVKAAHEAGVVHRDLKPENVLIQRDGGDRAIKILDFGLAKVSLLDLQDPDSLTLPGAVLGTLGYMSPEQVSGGASDERSDIFALGVLVVEALTGELPFKGATARDMMIATINAPYRLEGESPEIQHLDAVLQRCIAKDPAARFASIAELADELIPALLDCPPLVAPPAEPRDELPTRMWGQDPVGDS